jgi:3-dehydroquinate synthase
VKRIRDIYTQAKLPIIAPDLGPDTYLRLMGLDKKVEGGKLRFVLLKRIGEAMVRADVPSSLLIDTLTECTANA